MCPISKQIDLNIHNATCRYTILANIASASERAHKAGSILTNWKPACQSYAVKRLFSRRSRMNLWSPLCHLASCGRQVFYKNPTTTTKTLQSSHHCTYILLQFSSAAMQLTYNLRQRLLHFSPWWFHLPFVWNWRSKSAACVCLCVVPARKKVNAKLQEYACEYFYWDGNCGSHSQIAETADTQSRQNAWRLWT